MVAKKGEKAGSKVKSLRVKNVSAKQAKGVKGGAFNGFRPTESLGPAVRAQKWSK